MIHQRVCVTGTMILRFVLFSVGEYIQIKKLPNTDTHSHTTGLCKKPYLCYLPVQFRSRVAYVVMYTDVKTNRKVGLKLRQTRHSLTSITIGSC